MRIIKSIILGFKSAFIIIRDFEREMKNAKILAKTLSQFNATHEEAARIMSIMKAPRGVVSMYGKELERF